MPSRLHGAEVIWISLTPYLATQSVLGRGSPPIVNLLPLLQTKSVFRIKCAKFSFLCVGECGKIEQGFINCWREIQMMKILFAASEAVPFIKTGGLADVVGSLPKYFDKEKYDVRVMIPKYLCIRQELREKMKFVEKFYVKMNWRTQYVGVDEMEYDGVKYYFIDNE